MLENMPININSFRRHQVCTAVFKDSSDKEVTKQVAFIKGHQSVIMVIDLELKTPFVIEADKLISLQ
jgi:hypothetical protein